MREVFYAHINLFIFCFCLFFNFQSKHVGGCALFVLIPSNYLLHKASSYHIDVHCPLDVVLGSPIFVLRLHTCRVEKSLYIFSSITVSSQLLLLPTECCLPNRETNLIHLLLSNTHTHTHQAKHAVEGNTTWGVDGDTGNIVDMKEFGIWEPLSVKVQTYKTAIEVNIQI